MLELHFLNVGDGDAILIEDKNCAFRLLVDSGRKQVTAPPGSLEQSAAEHLRERGIDHIDVLVVTHLHEDHFGGLRELLKEVSVDEAYSGFFPPCPGLRAPEGPEEQKTVRGLIECLNLWAETAENLTAGNCRVHTISDTVKGLRFTEDLTVDIICPNAGVNGAQRMVWNAMLRGETVPEGLKYWASKSRNPNSLRLRLTYAGRRVELGGDCYGEDWKEKGLSHCDLLKVPHHGDTKALTPELIRKLRPDWAVISCGSEYIPRKDRPSRWTLELLREQGTQVYFTDSYEGSPRWRSVDFQITDDGAIVAPKAAGAAGGKT